MAVLVGMAEKVFEGEGGSYYEWTTNKMPVLATAHIGAAKLLLHNRGFGFPHYGDSTKIAYVLQGSGEGMAGLVSPDTNKERVVSLKKGDCFTVHKGVVSWWYNPGDSTLEVLFIGETNDAILPGHFTYLFLSGANGLINSFSSEFISKLYSITPKQASKISSSQAGMISAKLNEGDGPKPSLLALQDCFNFDGSAKRFTSGRDDTVNVGDVNGVEMCLFEVKLKEKGVFPPLYMVRAAAQVFYVVKGRVWVQIVSGIGVGVDEWVEEGGLFVVPKFYMVAMVGGDEPVECVSFLTTSKPVVGQLGNIWSALSQGGALEAALNLSSKDVEGEISNKIKKTLINN